MAFEEKDKSCEKLIGLVFYTLEGSNVLDIEFLVLLSEYHGQGIGTKTIDYLRHLYKCKKMTVCPFESVQGFYRKQGFVASERYADEWEKNFD